MSCFGCDSKISPSDYIDQRKNVYKISTSQIIFSLAVLPDGSLVSGGIRDIKVWNVDRKTCIATLSDSETYRSYVNSLVVLQGGHVASGYDDKKIRVWNVRTGSCVTTLCGHRAPIYGLAALPDGRLASTDFNDKIIKIWDVKKGTCVSNLTGLAQSAWSLSKLLNGQLVSGDHAGAIRVWNVSSGESEQILPGEGRVQALAILPDGRVAGGSSEGVISLWNLEGGVCEGKLLGHKKSVRALAILTDGRLASGSEDKTIRIWNLLSGRCEATLSGHTEGVNALALLPDGRLASGSSDKTIRVWNIETHHQTKSLAKSKVSTEAIIFDPFKRNEPDLMQNLDIIFSNKRLADRAFFPSSYIKKNDVAIEEEVALLTSYFSEHKSIQAFQAYRQFVEQNKAYYNARSSADWGRYPTEIINKNAFVFEGNDPDYGVFCHDGFKAAKNSGMLLLLCLAHLNTIEICALNQRRNGFTLLHYLMMQPENDLSVLCVSAMLIMGADPHIPGKGRLNNSDMENQTPIHVAKRLNKLRYFAALTNGANIQTVELPETITEKSQREAQLELKKREDLVKQELNKILLYILKNDAIEKFVTEENKAHFLKEAARVLATCPSFSTFQSNLLIRPDYSNSIYDQFKAGTARSIRDLKMRLSPTEIEFDEEELIMVFSNAVVTVERTLTMYDTELKAHQETIKIQTAVAQAAIDNKNILTRMQEEQRREREEQHRRQSQAAHNARMRAIIRTGLGVMEANGGLI